MKRQEIAIKFKSTSKTEANGFLEMVDDNLWKSLTQSQKDRLRFYSKCFSNGTYGSFEAYKEREYEIEMELWSTGHLSLRFMKVDPTPADIICNDFIISGIVGRWGNEKMLNGVFIF